MTHLCKDKEQAKKDAEKVAARKEAGKRYFVCKTCHRESHKEAHLCDAKQVK